MHRVVVLAVPGVVPFELAIPARLFGAAFAEDGSPLYAVTTCSLDGGPVRTSIDYSIVVERDASALLEADTVIVPPSRDPSLWSEHTGPSPAFVAALAAIPPGVRLVALCTGAFAVAAAGLLQGRRVTTHWREAERLQCLFPDLDVDAEVLFVDDGDVLTSAGVVAGVDLCLHLVRRDHGSATANEVARSCVVAPWRDGGQAQFIRRPVPDPAGSSTSEVRAWVVANLHLPIALGEMARRAAMSRRTFSRRFRDETGCSFGQWLVRQRLARARHLLEDTDLRIDQVAALAGLGSAASLRQHLGADAGVTPHAYRRTFHTDQREPSR